jgi:hypothetical protein
MTQPTDDGSYENYVPAHPPVPEQHAAGGEPLPVGSEPAVPAVPARHGPPALLAGLPYERFAIASTICITIWLMTDPGGYFWPMWVMLGTGVPVLVTLLARAR